MSVILENPHGEIVLYCKGADSVLLTRMNKNKLFYIKSVNIYLRHGKVLRNVLKSVLEHYVAVKE